MDILTILNIPIHFYLWLPSMGRRAEGGGGALLFFILFTELLITEPSMVDLHPIFLLIEKIVYLEET